LEAVPNEGVDVFNDLRNRGVMHSETFRHEGAVHQFAAKVFLDACLGQDCLQDWAHDVLHVFLADGRGCQQVLDCFHDGVVNGVPSFSGVDALGSDSICPLEGLAFKGCWLRQSSVHLAGTRCPGFRTPP